MEDRELLELAAKAANISHAIFFDEYPEDGFPTAYAKIGKGKYWNPLTDDGDAFRLMIRFRMWQECDDGICCVENPKDHGDDEAKSVRRAIVRAAAEIGKSLT